MFLWSIPLRVHHRPSMLWRRFSTRNQQTVRVSVGSEGYVTIDLHNITKNSPADTLIIYLPPSAFVDESSIQPIPKFLEDWPVASINYRWGAISTPSTELGGKNITKRLPWPIPVHDTAFAFQWITSNLMPLKNNRRGNIIVYGSYLGASLAASLSLTEAHPHTGFGIRGFAAYNGIYNWTMFLPDHPINKANISPKTASAITRAYESAHMNSLHTRIESLFDVPSNFFDPFASPSLFFHTPGLPVPSSFYIPAREAAMLNAKTGYDKILIKLLKPPQKSYLTFPPAESTLRIPQALLLHDSASTKLSRRWRAKSTRCAGAARDSHTFRVQVEELSSLMRRSIYTTELKEQNKWDNSAVEHLTEEAHRRVEVASVGRESEGFELSEAGQNILLTWIRNRI